MVGFLETAAGFWSAHLLTSDHINTRRFPKDLKKRVSFYLECSLKPQVHDAWLMRCSYHQELCGFFQYLTSFVCRSIFNMAISIMLHAGSVHHNPCPQIMKHHPIIRKTMWEHIGPSFWGRIRISEGLEGVQY